MQAIEAIKDGGVNVLEITMTVPGAVKVIEKVADKYGSEVLVGAGTVLDPETARACLLAGAQFIVSPALNLDTIALCHRYSAPDHARRAYPDRGHHGVERGCRSRKSFPVRFRRRCKLRQKSKGPVPADQDRSRPAASRSRPRPTSSKPVPRPSASAPTSSTSRPSAKATPTSSPSVPSNLSRSSAKPA